MERAGTNRVITGLPEIWKAAEEGRAFQLFVEKDYVHPGFLTTGDALHLHLRTPATPYRVLADAIDDLMQLVLDKCGEVIIVENGLLDACQRIALTTRY